MTKIKYIHCFGTSHTAGGGFEFNSTVKERDDIIREYYSIDDEEQTQFNYSYPGQLQKFISDDIKVFNHAKQGYGNDRMYRIFYDIINEDTFKKSENLFIFEFTGLGRREYFLNPLNEYITINWQHQYQDIHPFKRKKIPDPIYASLNDTATSYFYETPESWNFFGKEKEFFKKYVEYFINWDTEFKKLTMDIEFFLSYISESKVNYLFTSPPPIVKNNTSKEIQFGDDNYFVKSNDIIKFTWDNKLTIKDETNGGYPELHNGLKANKLCAHVIYNRLIKDGYIDSIFNEIDWKWYKNIKFVKPKLF